MGELHGTASSFFPCIAWCILVSLARLWLAVHFGSVHFSAFRYRPEAVLLLKHAALPLMLHQFLECHQFLVTAPLYFCCSLPHSSSLPAGNFSLAWPFGAAAKMLVVIDPDAQVVPALARLPLQPSHFLLLLVCAEHCPSS